ncbi:MAG: hypothetical protein PWQ59_2218, partial [Thermoanaerobacterium sp.]|nr:hypothetical protein [Thermoanaerobacterium sp.]
VNKDIFRENFNKLLFDSVKRREMSSNGQKILNGEGAKLCANKIIR